MNVKDAAWHTAHDYGFEELASRMGIINQLQSHLYKLSECIKKTKS